MTASTKYGTIRITKVPAGEAPLWVRETWVGLTLPCDPICGYPDKEERGLLSGTAATRNRYGYSVPVTEGLEILAQANAKAAQWIKDNVKFQPGDMLGFGEDEAEIVEGVVRQQIIEVRDEDYGDPER